MTQQETFPAERTAVLTGAASPRGIGRATAEMLASGGWAVAILDIDGDAARKAAAEITDVYGVTGGRGGRGRVRSGSRQRCHRRGRINAAADHWPGQPGRHQLTHGVHGRDPRGLGAGVQDQHDRHVPGHAAGAEGHDRAEAGQDRERLVHLRRSAEAAPTPRWLTVLRRLPSSASPGRWPGKWASTESPSTVWLPVPWTLTSWAEH